jgi:hypothetical protein
MKIKYTPGKDGLVGKTYDVEIVKMELLEVSRFNTVVLDSVTIQYKDGKKETITGNKLFNSIDMVQKSVGKRVY